MNLRNLVLLSLLVLFSGNAFADTNVSGTISSDTTWTLAASPYVVTGSVTVATGKVLTIEPGTTVKFNTGTNLTVQGTLTAIGTSTSGITFTSSAATPTRGSWQALRLQGGTNPASQLSYVTVSWGGSGYGTELEIISGAPVLDHVTAIESSSVGIKSTTSGAASFTYITASNNATHGMEITGTGGAQSGLVTISDSTFSSNGGYGLNFSYHGRGTVTNCTLTNNTNYAMAAEPGTDLQGLTGLTVSGNGSGAKNATEYRGGSIGTRDETWRPNASAPFVLSGSVTVNSGRLLTIEPGVTVKFNTSTNLTVQGTLTAVGTSTSGITFTSSAASPTRGSWQAVRLQGGTNPASQLSYVTVSWGGSGYGTELEIISGSPSLDHVTATESSSVGIKSTTSGAASFSYITASNNATHGMEIAGTGGAQSGLVTITNSTFSTNGGYGLNFTYHGRGNVTNSTITNNANYAIGAEPNTDLQGLTGLTVSGNGAGAKNATEYRGGSISARDETWRISPTAPFVVTGWVTVGSGIVLTVDPGVIVKFTPSNHLKVQGKLIALGTSSSGITFTSSAASPTRGSWQAILLQGGANPASQLSYVTVSWGGGNGYSGQLEISSGSATLDHITTIESATAGIKSTTTGAPSFSYITASNNASHGMEISGTGGTQSGLITITDSTFNANGGYGLNYSSDGRASVTNSTITNNTNYAIGAQPGTDVQGLTGLTINGNGSGTKNAIEYRGGTVNSRDETWRPSTNVPYVVSGQITVSPGRVLTVEPGALVKFNASTHLRIQGKLMAVGSSANGITFTSSAATPTRGSWQAVQLQGGTNPASQLSYVTVSWAGGNGYGGGIEISSGAPILDHVTVTQSATVGIKSTTTGAPSFSFVTVSNNATHGMEIVGSGTQTGIHAISDSTFSSNGGYGLNAGSLARATVTQSSFSGNTSGGATSSSNVIDARFCHWNAVTGPTGAGFGTGQSINANISFEPWLTALPTTSHRLALGIKNRTFNPAIATSSKVALSTAQSGNWTVNVMNSSEATLRTFTGSGASSEVAWDGKDGGGVTQPNGNYTYQVESVNGGDTAAPVRGRMIIDTSKQVTLTGTAAAPAFFSPNGDGQQETTTLSGTVNFDDANWTVSIKNGAGSTVRTGTGTGGAVSYVWDGRNDGGIIQPDAVYTLELAATAGTGSATGSAPATLDTAAPTATISFPASGQTVSNVYLSGSTDAQITGTASDANIASWTLDYGAGVSPGTWTVLATGTATVSNAALGTWATSALANGTYSIRLRVTDSPGNTSTSTVTPTLGNFSATQNLHHLNTAAAGTVTYTSAVPFTLNHSLTIKNSAGQIVRTFPTVQRSAGNHQDIWDGKDDLGAALPDGPYSYFITVSEGSSSATWDRTNQPRSSWAQEIAQTQSAGPFSPFEGFPLVITYTLPDAYRINIQVTKDGPQHQGLHWNCPTPSEEYRCIASAVYQPPGTHSFNWAGTYPDGQYDIRGTHVAVLRTLHNFPSNVTLVYGTGPKLSNAALTPKLFTSSGTQAIAFDLTTYQTNTANITIRVISQTTLQILRTITLSNQTAGRITANWDGKGDSGTLLPPGRYTVAISAESMGSSATLHAVTKITY